MMHQHKKILVFDKLWKRLRYKQVKELKYHSIPKSDLSSKKSSKYSRLFKLSNNSKTNITYNLRYVSYSIPLLCIMLLLGLTILPSHRAYAAQPTASLSVATPELSTTVAPGEIGYLSSNVTYSVNDAESYTLKVSYADSSNNLANGNQVIPGVGTNGMTGTSMKNADTNAWGYSWTEASNDDLEGLTYYTMPAYNNNLTGADLASGYLDGGTGDKASTTQKIVFAAKFASDNAYNGTYHTSVMLSLVATPQGIVSRKWSNGVDSGITTMQEMTPEICANSQVPVPASPSNVPILVLDDTRGGGYENSDIEGAYSNSYVIAKLGDGNCWMVQNMKLDLDTENALTPDNSNVSSNWPTTSALTTLKSTVAWVNDNAKPYYRNNPAALSGSEKYQDKYGYYYNWCAATAGTCVNSGEAASSICPKGWKLPTSNKATTVNGSFNRLNSIQGGTWAASSDNGLSNAPGRYIGYGFFPAAGYVASNSSLGSVGSDGDYWSSTAYNSSNAHDLYFGSSAINPSYSVSRSFGFSVRCVAPSTENL